jgi:hypothetical protein
MSVDDEVLAAQLARVRRERDRLSKIVAFGLDMLLQVRVDLASRGIAVDAATDRAIAKFDRLARSMRRIEHG